LIVAPAIVTPLLIDPRRVRASIVASIVLIPALVLVARRRRGPLDRAIAVGRPLRRRRPLFLSG
jgi:hypothetical protein